MEQYNTTSCAEIIPFSSLKPVISKSSPAKYCPDPTKLKTTIAVKKEDDLDAIKQELLYHFPKYGIRNFLIFWLGCHIGIRAGDLLTLRLRDIWDTNTHKVRNIFYIMEEKTDKIKEIRIRNEVLEAFNDYIPTLSDQSPDAPLFPSRKKAAKISKKSMNRDKDDTGCLTTDSYGAILREVGKALGIPHLCTHSMRKTYGYTLYTSYAKNNQLVNGQYRPADFVQHEFGHKDLNITLKYIDIAGDAREEAACRMH